MKTIKNFLTAAMAGSLIATSLFAAEQQQLTLGIGNSMDAYHQLGSSICRTVNQETTHHGISCATESAEETTDNIKDLRSGDIDLVLIRSDWHSYVYKGSHLFEDEGAFKALRTLASFHPHSFTILARAAADIRTFYDLRGKRVNLGSAGSEARAIMEGIMKGYKWSSEAFAAVSELAEDEQAQALCDNRADAAVYVAHHPAAKIEKATDSCDLRLVRVDGNPIKRLIAKDPNYRWTLIPSGIYKNNEHSIRTFGMTVKLVGSSELDADMAYALTKAIFSNKKEMERFEPVLDMLEDNLMSVSSVPLHKGTLKYHQDMEM